MLVDGVRRAKAAQLAGIATLPVRLVYSSGHLSDEFEVELDSLLSPKSEIRRVTASDEIRWTRVVQGCSQKPCSFPSLLVKVGTRGTLIADVYFDFGNSP